MTVCAVAPLEDADVLVASIVVLTADVRESPPAEPQGPGGLIIRRRSIPIGLSS